MYNLLQTRRNQQLDMMAENKEYMKEWERKGYEAWEANNTRIATRKQKDEDLDKFLTMRYVNKLKQKQEDAAIEVEKGVDEFIEIMQRQGIEDGPNLEAPDRPQSNVSTRSGFNYAATMNKIKEKKKKYDYARKEKDIRLRKQKVDQIKTE